MKETDELTAEALADLSQCLAPKFTPPGSLEILVAYRTLRQAAAHRTGAGAFARNFLQSILKPTEFEISDLSRLDQENSHAAIFLFMALSTKCGEVRDIVECEPSDAEIELQINRLKNRGEED